MVTVAHRYVPGDISYPGLAHGPGEVGFDPGRLASSSGREGTILLFSARSRRVQGELSFAHDRKPVLLGRKAGIQEL
jgi:hypothetical protein